MDTRKVDLFVVFLVVVASTLIYTYMKPKKESKKENKKPKTYLYFGYGSNLSIFHMKNVKNLKITSVLGPGIIKNYDLSFSMVTDGGIGIGNIHPAPNKHVEGLIIELSEPELAKLTKLEFNYERHFLQATLLKTNKNLTVVTYIFTQNRCNELNKLFKNGGGYEYNINGIPDENYLNTLIYGAKKNGISKEWVLKLTKFKYKPMKKFNTKNDFDKPTMDKINKKIWNWNEINNEINKNNRLIGVIKGIVVDFKNTPIMWAKKMCGGEFTMFMAARWAQANHDNLKSINTLEDKQKDYINAQIGTFLNGCPKPVMNMEIIGKLSDDEEWGYNKFDW